MNKFYFFVSFLIGISGVNVLYAQAPVLSYPTPQTFAVNQPITPIPVTNTGAPVPNGYYAQSSTVAGNGYYGYKDTSVYSAASFSNPIGIAQDPAGNVFVADANNNAIRKITPDGTVTTFAGGGAAGTTDGIGQAARFNYPTGLAADIYGNIYVADFSNSRIRKITPAGVVTTMASTGFNLPYGLAIDGDDNVIVADTYNNMIKKVTQNGVVTVIAGNNYSTALTDGTGTTASFNLPYGVIVDKTGNIFVTDRNHNAIRKITPAGNVTTFTHNSNTYQPSGITIDSLGTLYVTNGIGFITKINAAGQTSVFAGADSAHNDGVTFREGVDTSARFAGTDGITYDPGGNVVIADGSNFLIRIVSLNGYQITPELPLGISIDGNGTISGSPDTLSTARDYTITGYTPTSSGSTVININVANIAPQTITFNPMPNVMYGDTDLANVAISTNPTIPIVYSSSNTAVATVVSGNIHIAGVGTATITANQPGNANFTVAAPVSQTLTVTPAVLTITANDQYKITSQTNPPLTLRYSGFIATDDTTVFTTKPTVQTTATASSAAGGYPITASGAAANNYSFSYVAGTLTVSPLPTITASGQTAFLAGDSVILSVSLPSDYTYQWNYNGSAIPGATNSAYTAIISGAYTVSVTLNSKTATSAPVTITAAFTLPPQNFTLQINAVTCKGSNNGTVLIKAAQKLNYIATVTDSTNTSTLYQFTDSLSVTNLKPGTYIICIAVNGQVYDQCYSVKITEPQDLSVYSVVNKIPNTITLQLYGGNLYNVNLNGTVYTTSQNQLTLPLAAGNNKILITTDKLCQGMLEKDIVINDYIPYPNPFTDVLSINLGNAIIKQAQVSIYNIVSGKQVYSNTYINQTGILQLDMKILAGGAYYLNLNLDNTLSSYKILKK